ncbi:hypothetical protein ACS0TY_021467 [Phlomoides rotata]
MGFEDYKTIVVMVGCQFIYSGMILSVRAALLEDLSSRVLVVYRQIIATLLIAPFAYFSRRGTNSCRLNWRSFWLIFLLSFVGVTANQNANFEGLALVPSSVATAIGNLAPAITFIMSYIFGLEKVRLRNSRSVAKIMGTVVCVSGAAAMALYKGPKLLNMEFLHSNSLFLQSSHLGQGQYTWLVGCLLLFGGVCCLSFWLILQVPLNACYPDHLSSTAWICLMSAIQSGLLTLITEPNINSWKLNSRLQLFSCVYAGMTSAITFFAQAWCISRKGPLFTAMFQPLSTVIVTVLACIFMHEELYTGSMIGALAVIIGLYIVLWGKSKDVVYVKQETTLNPHEVSHICKIDLEEPLLPDKPAN